MEEKYKQFIASERGEDINDIWISDETFNGKPFQWLATPGHSFLIVPASSMYYNLAKKVRSADGYGYIMPGQAVFLEEDCQAGAFISKLPQGQAITAEQVDIVRPEWDKMQAFLTN